MQTSGLGPLMKPGNRCVCLCLHCCYRNFWGKRKAFLRQWEEEIFSCIIWSSHLQPPCRLVLVHTYLFSLNGYSLKCQLLVYEWAVKDRTSQVVFLHQFQNMILWIWKQPSPKERWGGIKNWIHDFWLMGSTYSHLSDWLSDVYACLNESFDSLSLTWNPKEDYTLLAHWNQ